ncbi:MAG TPA: hypothetical protein VM076_16130 [Gemmatimonadaceae bacterium]|nr:hypothetical protein [Gemmatimonadaceae bacterium]
MGPEAVPIPDSLFPIPDAGALSARTRSATHSAAVEFAGNTHTRRAASAGGLQYTRDAMYTDFPDPFAPHIMMLSEWGTASGDALVERAADVFDVLSMKPDLDTGDSDHVRRRVGRSVILLLLV